MQLAATGTQGALQSDSLRATSEFTDDNRMATIDNGTYNNTFTYGPGGNRFMVERKVGTTATTKKYYDGCNEYIGDTSRTFIYAPTGICAVWEKVGTNPGKLYYIHTDYLGSWLKITNQDQSVDSKHRYSYDAWGRPRNPDTWEPLPISTASALVNLNAMQPRFDRGYTGHEQMAGFGLINMNGRLYDPYLQRFLSPDNVVQDPLNAQSYNRYSYCLNNPLMYTDPTGWQMAPIDQFWNLGKAVTNQTRFNNYAGPTGEGWGGFGTGGGGAGNYINRVDIYTGVNLLLNSTNGGSWSRDYGLYYFHDQDEAFIAGCLYNRRHNSWGNTSAKSADVAYSNFKDAGYGSHIWFLWGEN